jgi:hypothetical protein
MMASSEFLAIEFQTRVASAARDTVAMLLSQPMLPSVIRLQMCRWGLPASTDRELAALFLKVVADELHRVVHEGES